MTRLPKIPLALVTALVLGACGGQEKSPSDDAQPTPATPAPSSTDMAENLSPDPGGKIIVVQMLTDDQVSDRLAVQNVGDFERVLRTVGGAVLLLAARLAPRARWPLALMGTFAAASGLTGWCPIYHAAGVTSLEGPGDRPDEVTRTAWLAARRGAMRDVAALASPETQ